jgi:ABC-type nickel/cobalt efflux system permease component RcnA
MLALATSCWLGFLIGLRHALDPDHLAAMSTLVVDQPRRQRAAVLGAWWGVGHSAALLGAGALLLLCRVRLPDRAAEVFELAVSVMLIALGARSLRRALRARGGAPVEHAHGHVVHAHDGAADHFHLRSLTIARRPFLVGLVHGLAGTGAITALALASMPTVGSALAYITLFALGSVGGMALLTGAAGVPIARLARRPAAHAALMGSVGALSLLVGLVWGAPIVGRLLLGTA